jgi:hypothetical protein
MSDICTSTDEEVVDWIIEHFPFMRKYERKARTSTGKPIFDAVVTSRETLRLFIQAVRPFVVIQRKQERLDAMWDWIVNPPRIGRERQDLCNLGHELVRKENGKGVCPTCQARLTREWRERTDPSFGMGRGAPGVRRKSHCVRGHDLAAVPVGQDCPLCVKARNDARALLVKGTGPGRGGPGVKRKLVCKSGHDISAVPPGKDCPQCAADRFRAWKERQKQ